jgi:hypothetical protein
MDTATLKEWETRLAEDVAKLRENLNRKEEELHHIRSLLHLHEPSLPEGTAQDGSVPTLTRRSLRRMSIAELRPVRFEYQGRTFTKPGDLLDFVGEPHYYSRLRSGGDAAQRRIIKWAKDNAAAARDVKVILRDGRAFSLQAIVEASRTQKDR